MVKSKYLKKDSPTRSILKALSWRVIASAATFVITYIIVRQSSGKTDTEALKFASAIASVDVVAKLILYYLHERLWTNIYWGKYWSKKIWRRKYRKMHKKLEALQNLSFRTKQ
jgi:uncharacterized membrane protein